MALLDLKVFKERTFYDKHFGINWVKKVKNSSKKRASAFLSEKRRPIGGEKLLFIFTSKLCP